jgi:hypothetical protein
MIFLLLLTLILNILLVLSPAWWSTRILGLPPINPLSIAVACSFPMQFFIFFSPLFLGTYISIEAYLFTSVVTLINQLVQLLATLVGDRIVQFKKILSSFKSSHHLRPRHIFILAAITFILYLIFLSYIAFKTGGLPSWISNPRDAYISRRSGYGAVYAFSQSLLFLSFYAYCNLARKPWFLILGFFFYIAFAYLLGSKAVFVQFLIVFIFFFWRLSGPRRTLLLGLIIVPFTAAFIVVNYLSSYSGLDITIGLDFFLSYFDHCQTTQQFFADYLSGSIKLFEGQVLLTSWYQYIPRTLFPDKPFVYGILYLNEHYFPGMAELGHTPAFNCGASEFADFGFPGLILFSLLTPSWLLIPSWRLFLSESLDRSSISFRPPTISSFLLGLFLLAPGFYTYFSGPSVLFLAIAVYSLSFLSRIRI